MSAPVPPIVFDIETGPLPDAVADRFMPEFSAPGNYKDPEKIAANIVDQQREWKTRLALSPLTGGVLAIGVHVVGGGDSSILHGESEARIIESFWAFLEHSWPRKVIGFNCRAFDIPFLMRRSWALGVRVPDCITSNGRPAKEIIDLMELWQVGDKRASVSLNNLALHLGFEGKDGSGADFARLYAADQEAALDYLRHDLALTTACAVRMGVVNP
jgi:DNA polymerase elongation subunit (family B)